MILSIFQIFNPNILSLSHQNPDASKIEIIKPTLVDGFDDIFRICDSLGLELTDDHLTELHLDGKLDYEDFLVTGRLFKVELLLETKEEFKQLDRMYKELTIKRDQLFKGDLYDTRMKIYDEYDTEAEQ